MNSRATLAKSVDAGGPVSLEIHHEVQSFLFREARILDEERYRDWLATLTDDIHYWLPVQENRYRNDKRPAPTPATAASVYNDYMNDLLDRVARYETGMAWIEDPPARLRRLVSNVEAEYTDNPQELKVYSNILLYRNRRQREESWFPAGRQDLLRKVGGAWKLARRHIVFAQLVIMDENLTVFL